MLIFSKLLSSHQNRRYVLMSSNFPFDANMNLILNCMRRWWLQTYFLLGPGGERARATIFITAALQHYKLGRSQTSHIYVFLLLWEQCCIFLDLSFLFLTTQRIGIKVLSAFWIYNTESQGSKFSQKRKMGIPECEAHSYLGRLAFQS